MAADDAATFEALKKYYREGIPKRSVAENEADARILYQFLWQLGGEELVGSGTDPCPGYILLQGAVTSPVGHFQIASPPFHLAWQAPWMSAE